MNSYHRDNITAFSLAFLLTTIGVAYAITSLVNINGIADPALVSNQQWIAAGLGLAIVGWILSISAIGVSGSSVKYTESKAMPHYKAEFTLLTFEFLFLLAAAVLLLLAAARLDRVLYRALFIFTVSAGVFIVVAAAIVFGDWLSKARRLGTMGRKGVVSTTVSAVLDVPLTTLGLGGKGTSRKSPSRSTRWTSACE